MTDTPTVYQSLVSARSRRLRLTGILLLIAVLGMTLYGYLALMPSLRTLPRVGAHKRPGVTGQISAAPRQSSQAAGAVDPVTGLTEQERKAALAKVVFVYGYWSVCGVLILALVIVSWLDFRELSRNYDAHRQSLFTSTLNAKDTEEHRDIESG